jgi:hypothetical protein
MQNIKVSTRGTTLIIEIDASTDLGLSKSGKTHLVASTQGNKLLTVAGRDIYLGINAYTAK